MYKQFTEESRRSMRSILRIMVLLIPVAIIIYGLHLDSRQAKQQYAKIIEEKEAFLSCFDIYVQQSGYLKKQVGVQDIYVPSLRIRVSNLSDQELSNLMFDAYFQRDGKSFCRAAATVMRLRTLETKDIYLRCIDSAVFGSLVSGLSLMETTGDIGYRLYLSSRNIQVTVAEGKVEFSLFFP